MKKMKLLNVAVFAMLTTFFVSCGGDDDNAPVNPKEEITRMVVEVKNQQTNEVAEYEYGITGSQNIFLKDNVWYDVKLHFFNQSTDVTSEILAEKDEHFIKFEYNGNNLELIRDSFDNQIGLYTEWKATGVTTNTNPKTIKINLIHKPKSDNPSGNSNFGTSSGGSSDFSGIYGMVVTE